MLVVPALAQWRDRVVERRRDTAVASWAMSLNTAAIMALLVTSLMNIAARTYNPFIYFRF